MPGRVEAGPAGRRIRLPCPAFVRFFFHATRHFQNPEKMKIRSLLIALSLALAAGPVVRADETPLGERMEKMGGAFRALRRQIADASKNADSLAKLATLRKNAEESLKFDPALAKDQPADKRQKFIADYQAEMKKFLELCTKLEAALKANKNAEAEKLCAAMGDAQKAGHKQFKKDDKKK